MGSFGPARCAILSAGRNGSGLRGMFRRWIWKTDSVVILIGFIRKATCAITSAKLLKFCATKELFIASPRYDSGGNYSVAYKARRSGPGDWCRLLSDCAKETGISGARARPLRQRSTDRKIPAAWDCGRKHRGSQFRLGWPALYRTDRPPPHLRLDHCLARARTHH